MRCHTQEQILIAGPSGDLEVSLTCTANSNASIPYGIICHPHSLYGGSMNNKVVYIIASAFNQLGAGVVRFNFRGVGQSEGQFDQGRGETEDLQAVATWLQQHYTPQALWLAGFSFGSYVALCGQAQLNPARLLLVAPPVEHFEFEPLSLPAMPTLIIQGEQDEIVSIAAVTEWIDRQQHQPQFHRLTQSSHFFHGQLTALRRIITNNWSRHNGNSL
ncbi:MAG: alpha/beta fold hydrolase [Pseudomonadota bacterium]|nr:alpha/beta fold hydrolase [Pseudomonadota bacterium]